MKTIKPIALIFLISLGSIVGNAQEALQSWDYPIKPGTEEWKAFKTNKELVAACQLPEEVLKTVSTPYLLEVCLNYPLFDDIYLKESLADGVKLIINSFNGLSELVGREDFTKTIVDLYMNEQLPQPLVEAGPEYYRILHLDILIGTSEIVEHLDGDTRLGLMREALSKMQEKMVHDYSVFFQSGSALILSRMLSTDGSSEAIAGDFVLKTFNETWIILDLSIIEKIESLAVKYLEDHEEI
jgi:hypothetical protein